MTPDIVKLRDSLPTLEPIIERLELELVDDPAWHEPSDTSYLSDADREDPDIAANLEAMRETNRLIAWFGRDAEGYLGLWRGPNDRSLVEAPVVRLDGEGQYAIIAATVPEYLAIAMPEDEFAATRDALTSAGFTVGFNPDAIWGALDAFDDDPNAYRRELYERARVARGLPRTDAEEEAGDAADDDAGSSAPGHDDLAAAPAPHGELAFESHEGRVDDDADQDDEVEHAGEAVPAPRPLAEGTMPAMVAAGTELEDTELDFGSDDDEEDELGEPDGEAAKVGDDGVADDDDDDDDDELEDDDDEPPPMAARGATPVSRPAASTSPAKTAAAKKVAAKPPAKQAASKAPAKKAASKAPAKKAASKAPAKKAASKAPAKKAASKAPAKKAASKAPAKKARAKKAASKARAKAARPVAKKAVKPTAKKAGKASAKKRR